MLDIKFKEEERTLKDMQDVFNEVILDQFYPAMLEFNHYELWEKSGKLFNPQDWKTFRTHPRVDEWYTEELVLLANTKAFKLLSKAGDNRSVGEVQALNASLSIIDKYMTKKQSQTKIIYCFIPLTESEEAAPNVRIIKNIPAEIDDAIVRPERD
jgi:hypothetical protein